MHVDKEQIMIEFSTGEFKDLFPLKIYEAEYPDFHKIKQKILDDLEPHFSTLAPGNQYVNDSGSPLIYRTMPNLEKDPNFKELIEFAEHHGRIYWKECNLTTRVDPYVLHMWSNKIPPGGFTPVHVHTPMPVAAAFYIHATDDMGVLEIENPIDTIQKMMPRDNNLAPYYDTHRVKVSDGKLVLFPGWVRHFTRSNLTKENRVIVSFNIGANISYHAKNH
jgi:uncharacterized protein (TIGR02466 family)